LSGKCDKCGDHTLECICRCEGDYVLARTCGSGCPCHHLPFSTHLNLVRRDMADEKKYSCLSKKTDPFCEGIDPPAHLPERRYVNVRGREEHEAIIKDAAFCKELGLDQIYETMVYLKRWGGWLQN
jgi:hypothetical protein